VLFSHTAAHGIDDFVKTENVGHFFVSVHQRRHLLNQISGFPLYTLRVILKEVNTVKKFQIEVDRNKFDFRRKLPGRYMIKGYEVAESSLHNHFFAGGSTGDKTLLIAAVIKNRKKYIGRLGGLVETGPAANSGVLQMQIKKFVLIKQRKFVDYRHKTHAFL
jgi:hypothetical protein